MIFFYLLLLRFCHLLASLPRYIALITSRFMPQSALSLFPVSARFAYLCKELITQKWLIFFIDAEKVMHWVFVWLDIPLDFGYFFIWYFGIPFLKQFAIMMYITLTHSYHICIITLPSEDYRSLFAERRALPVSV